MNKYNEDLIELNSSRVGDMGEHFIHALLRKSGYTDIVAIQNASGHGVDIVATKNGKLHFFEVKSSAGKSAPGLSDAQSNADNFIETRLERAANGQGQWAKVDSGVQAIARQYLRRIRSGEGVYKAVAEVTSVETNPTPNFFEWP